MDTRLDELVPAYAMRVLEVLEDAGHEAWIVGGWVRDALLGEVGSDVDITCSALWEDTERALLAKDIPVERTGIAHGTITALVDGAPIEVTTYRREGTYTDHRHPDEVVFVDDVETDLARRDLTINAIAYNPRRGLRDPFSGISDLERGVIRTVGDPFVRFEEDALRIIRAVRFALRLDFTMDPRTHDALNRKALSLKAVASERVGTELVKIVEAGHAGRALMEYPDVMCAAIPDLQPSRGFDQKSVYHIFDVYTHIAHVCKATEAFTVGLARPELRWAALLHDIAKPETYSEDVIGHGHFFDHPRRGAEIAREVMGRMGIPNQIVSPACTLIKYHDEPMPATPYAIRKLLRKISKDCPGREVEVAFELFDLRRADAISKSPSAAAWVVELDTYTKLLRKEVRRGPVFDTKHLKISGADVIRALDIKGGPAVGMNLQMILSAVMRGELDNNKSDQIAWLKGEL